MMVGCAGRWLVSCRRQPFEDLLGGRWPAKRGEEKETRESASSLFELFADGLGLGPPSQPERRPPNDSPTCSKPAHAGSNRFMLCGAGRPGMDWP